MPNKRLEAIAADLKQVGRDLARGDATEHTHHPALQQLIQQLQKGIVCVNEPKGSSAAGHPDMKVLPEWFEFHLGGYQVLQKWLKDRKGRKLSTDDITHYQRVVVIIEETISLMSGINNAIRKWPTA